MFHRQKVLLSLLEAFGGELPSTDFQKYLFLYTRLCEKEHSYEFVPYKFGCFSFQSYGDKSKLIEHGYLENQSDWKLAGSSNVFSNQLKKGEREKIEFFVSKYGNLKGRNLLRHVYKGYPYYAINSLIAQEILSDVEYSEVKKLNPTRRGYLFATIGYEGNTVEQYINKLIKNDVRILIDVRKNPLSRKYGFSKRKLSELLSKVGIDYQHIPELGIIPDKRKTLSTASDYQALFDDYEETVLISQKASLIKLYETYLANKRVAITCFEQCHTMCHRHKVANAIEDIAKDEFKIIHI
ncbi:MAG: DUF488 domain-containing protein [Candidatus Thiodiazotropha taylori]|nr:DUF488 domain-containing protein [Candidatus Thiodiazotropha taylori]MCW4224161.1 DUF488 domain-containing protein [Candidatus Thiodiazotropha endolucinida]MCG7885737.1 DUF488 domain-containing protein [Candidatus Thiodiazotropha taylori]MCG7892704.1 DUF488 domain-containing protein [Candidatus Thiodiazotropha taylori]MCG8031978.1 DUF488 domain-containing protein [Candidatus Thiodiazotropha taylori]